MKLYTTVTIMSTDTGYANADVKLFKDSSAATQSANNDIDRYAREYQGIVTDRSRNYYIMKSDLMTVKIKIEEHEI